MLKVKHKTRQDLVAYSEICEAFEIEQQLAKIVNCFSPRYLPGARRAMGGGAVGWENRGKTKIPLANEKKLRGEGSLKKSASSTK